MDQALGSRNPYLDAAQGFVHEYTPEDPWGRGLADGFILRRKLVGKYAWAVPNEKALTRMLDFTPLVEVGAGSGYWARLLQERGADVLAFDARPPGGDAKNEFGHAESWTAVKRGGPEVLSAPGMNKRALFLCWPPMELMAEECLRTYTGDHVLYVGELYGCTATDAFHEELDREWSLIDEVDIPQWYGMHDRLRVYRRK